jgi:excisionase family DNA binding protein
MDTPGMKEVKQMEKLLTVKEVAEVLQLTQMSVYRLCNEGKIPCIKIGGSIRISKTALQKLIQLEEVE